MTPWTNHPWYPAFRRWLAVDGLLPEHATRLLWREFLEFYLQLTPERRAVEEASQ